MTDRQTRDARVRARWCLFPGCDQRAAQRWTMCNRHHSAGGPVVNYWRGRAAQERVQKTR